MESNTKSTKIIGIILFIMSYIPYFYLLFIGVNAAINGSSTGLFGDGPMAYGVEAFAYVTVWGIIGFIFIPILPACILYQAVYTCIRVSQIQDALKEKIIRYQLIRKSINILGALISIVAVIAVYCFQFPEYENIAFVAAFFAVPIALHYLLIKIVFYFRNKRRK